MSQRATQPPTIKESTSGFKIIGHRGAAGLQSENTLPSFKQALISGCCWLELDVHCIANGTLVVIHDDTLERTTNARGAVAALRQEDLATIDAGNGAKLPTLAEVCAEISRHAKAPVTLNIELKGVDTARPTAAFLSQAADLPACVIVSSFNHSELARFRAVDAHTPVAVLLDRWQSDWCEVAEEMNAGAINLSRRIVNLRRVQAIKEAGFKVYVYTINRPARARDLAAMGVDGIFTDRPDRMSEFMT